jgi:hypothetical protein
MVDLQMARNASQVEAIDIQLNRLLAQAVRVASGLWVRGVFALAVHAFVALRTSAGLPGFILAIGSFTVGTFHFGILPHPIRHSRKMQKIETSSPARRVCMAAIKPIG